MEYYKGNYKRNQTEILGLKITIIKIKNFLEGLNNRFELAGAIIS